MSLWLFVDTWVSWFSYTTLIKLIIVFFEFETCSGAVQSFYFLLLKRIGNLPAVLLWLFSWFWKSARICQRCIEQLFKSWRKWRFPLLQLGAIVLLGHIKMIMAFSIIGLHRRQNHLMLSRWNIRNKYVVIRFPEFILMTRVFLFCPYFWQKNVLRTINHIVSWLMNDNFIVLTLARFHYYNNCK